MSKIKCYKCRDKGMIGGCPDCGKVLGKIIITNQQQPDGKVEDDSVFVADIPTYYRDRVWDKELLLRDKPDLMERNKFRTFADKLEKVHNMFRAGVVPNKSALFIAPRTFSKMVFAYSCMKAASENGFKVFPKVMDTQELKIFMLSMSERPNSKFSKAMPYTYLDLITSDVLFVTVSKGQYRKKAFEVIDEIIDIRSRMDKATFIISRFSLDEICEYDNNKTFISMFTSDKDKNALRYPLVIQFTNN